MRHAVWLAVLLAMAGCAGGKTRPEPPAIVVRPPAPGVSVPAFVARSYEPFSRSAVVAIALREWRLFGQPVDDDPPGTRPPPLPEDKPERMQGLWQRVGEYWFLSQDPQRREAAWTGKHDASGSVFPASDDGDYAWSAAFVSYVMRIADAGDRFPYSPAHHDYIDAGREVSIAREHGTVIPGWVVSAERIDVYAPQPGDLICESRTRKPLQVRGPAGRRLRGALRHRRGRGTGHVVGGRRQRG